MEVITQFTSLLHQKEKELKELNRERKKAECKLDIVEKEKNICR